VKYLVTGAAGFIGAAIARELVARGDQVYIIDNLVTGYRENVPRDAEFLKLDLSEQETFKKLPRVQFDAVLHLAAQSSGEISYEKPAYDLMTNTLGTLLLLNWCKENRVKRFVYASSMSVYGDVKDEPICEDRSCSPQSFYGITKQASENYIRLFSDQGMKTTIFRMFNVYGPGQNLANMKQGMVSIYLAYVLRQQPIAVRGSKERFRDFIYIDDVVSAWLSALHESRTFGQIYNLASGRKTYVWELIEALLKTFGYDTTHYPVQYGAPTPGDQLGIYADVTKLKLDLGWSPRVDLSDGLRRMVDWARSSKWANGIAFE
jgi:UDP-glucose 4-epimerase